MKILTNFNNVELIAALTSLAMMFWRETCFGLVYEACEFFAKRRFFWCK